nr:hypothetical protein [Tanacetum cinerariifolium]
EAGSFTQLGHAVGIDSLLNVRQNELLGLRHRAPQNDELGVEKLGENGDALA